MIKIVLININQFQRILIKLRGFVFASYTSEPKTRRWKTSEFDETASEKTRGFRLRDFRFECSAKWKTWSSKSSEFYQSTSEFDQNASEKFSEVFISEFSVLALLVQNGKLEVENLGN